MIQTCNADYWRWMPIIRDRIGAPCGQTFDDVDHSTRCPHDELPQRVDLATYLEPTPGQAVLRGLVDGLAPPRDPMADLQRAINTLAEMSRVIICTPDREPAVRQAIADSPFPGLLDVMVSEHVPEDRVFVVPKALMTLPKEDD